MLIKPYPGNEPDIDESRRVGLPRLLLSHSTRLATSKPKQKTEIQVSSYFPGLAS